MASSLVVTSSSASQDNMHLVQPVVIDGIADGSVSDSGSVTSWDGADFTALDEQATARAGRQGREAAEPRRPHVLTWRWEHRRTGELLSSTSDCEFECSDKYCALKHAALLAAHTLLVILIMSDWSRIRKAHLVADLCGLPA